MVVVGIWRLLGEEHYLERGIAGYPEYRQKVRYRLMAGIYRRI